MSGDAREPGLAAQRQGDLHPLGRHRQAEQAGRRPVGGDPVGGQARGVQALVERRGCPGQAEDAPLGSNEPARRQPALDLLDGEVLQELRPGHQPVLRLGQTVD